MYLPDKGHYKEHLERYGHPSEVGFKEIIRDWKAERFEPDALVDFYRKSGARYFVAMANHHDNLDLWNSTHQPWNSVAVGPKRDLIAGWASAAQKAGLRFGVSPSMDILQTLVGDGKERLNLSEYEQLSSMLIAGHSDNPKHAAALQEFERIVNEGGNLSKFLLAVARLEVEGVYASPDSELEVGSIASRVLSDLSLVGIDIDVEGLTA
jgi:alpha-L-fucosidase